MDGEIVKIEQYQKDETPWVFLVEDRDEKKRFEYSDYLPIQKGDLISVSEKISKKEKGNRYILEEKPLVYIPQKPDDLKRHFQNAISKSRKGKKIKCPRDIGEKLYEEMMSKFEDHDRILNVLNIQAVEFFVTVNDREKNYIYNWWNKNIMKRQLYLFGLYNREITESGLREDLLFEKIKDNPAKISSLNMEKVKKINNIFSRETSQKDIECGEILRKIDEYRKRGWFFVPSFVLKKSYPLLEKNIEYMIQEYDIIHEEGRIYTKHNYHVEHVVASKFVELIKIDKMVKNIPNIGGKKYTIFGKHDLTDQQLMALEGCLKYNLCVVTGGAGCGKTTLLLEIVKNLEKTGRKVVLTSFTGKAVMRIKEVLDSPKEYDEKCVTLHRLIHRKKTYQKIPRFDVLVIDEASMVSTGLLFQFFSLFTEPFRIILIGDCNQLEPVESGSLLREIIDSELVPTYRLTKNKRTDNSGSMIIKNASGLVSPDRNFDIPFRFSSGEGLYMVSGGIEKIRKIIKSLSGAGIDDKSMTVLSPVNKYIQEITRFHQKYYLRKSEKYSYRDVFYHIGDRMMQKKNYYSDDFEIMNGEEGYIVEINEDFLEIDFGNKKISYGWESRDKNSRKEEDATDGDDLTVDSISHSFCKTIHKSQGSEYEYVIVFLPPDQYNFVTLNMLYTAVTRAKKSVWIVGEQSTVDIVTTKTQKKRYETLSEKMKKMF